MPPEELANNFFNLPPPVQNMPPRMRPPPGYGPPGMMGRPPMPPIGKSHQWWTNIVEGQMMSPGHIVLVC